jgi:hypothetical protein
MRRCPYVMVVGKQLTPKQCSGLVNVDDEYCCDHLPLMDAVSNDLHRMCVIGMQEGHPCVCGCRHLHYEGEVA